MRMIQSLMGMCAHDTFSSDYCPSALNSVGWTHLVSVLCLMMIMFLL